MEPLTSKNNHAKFDVDQWLESIDIWDKKYDYVMHNRHWLTSEWDPKCPQCQAKPPKRPTPKPASCTVTTATVTTAPAPARQPPPPPPPTPKVPVQLRVAPTVVQPQPPEPVVLQSSPPATIVPPAPSIPATPVALVHLAGRQQLNFATPSLKFNDTYTRTTRQSTRKLLQTPGTNQDLINLNETFDLYKSALADTPDNDTSMVISGAATTNGIKSTTMQQPPKPLSNFELLTNPTATANNGTQDLNPASLQEIENQEYAQPVMSRIPRIPVRLSRNHDF